MKKGQNVVGFLRVSTDQQTSVKEQKSIVTDYAKKGGLLIIETIIEEGVSGYKAEREGFNRLIELINSGEIKGILCWELSRIGRKMIQTLQLLELCEDKNVWLKGIKDGVDSRTESGRLQLKLMAVIYEAEGERIRRRIRDTLQTKKSNGMVYNGRLAYGLSRKGDQLITNDFEMKNVRRIKNLISRGHTTYSIAKRFNEEGIATKEGGKWQQNTIKRVMKYHYNISS